MMAPHSNRGLESIAGNGWCTRKSIVLALIPGMITLLGGSGSGVHAEEDIKDDNPYALCGGTREACDPFSYLYDDYAIPERGDYVEIRRPGYSRPFGPWGSYPSPYGYRGPPVYWRPPGFWGPVGPVIPPGAWPIPVPFGGANFGPPISTGFSGFFGTFGGGSGFYFGVGNPVSPPFHVGVQPIPGPNFHPAFGTGRPGYRPPGFPAGGRIPAR